MARACLDFYGTRSPLHDPRFTSSESPRVFGAIIGLVDLVDVHAAVTGVHVTGDPTIFCCDSPWAENEYVEHGGRTRRALTHLVLANPRPVDPIPCQGRLGLWNLPADVIPELEAALT